MSRLAHEEYGRDAVVKGSLLRARFWRLYEGASDLELRKIAVDANAAFVALAEARPDLFNGYMTMGMVPAPMSGGMSVVVNGQTWWMDIDRWVADIIAVRDHRNPLRTPPVPTHPAYDA